MTKTVTSTVLNKQAARQAEIMATAVAAAMLAGLRPLLEALAQDKTDRHNTANVAQTASDTAHDASERSKVNESRIANLEKRMEALMGDGTGENGKLAAMDRKLNTVQADMGSVKADVQRMSESIGTLLESSRKSGEFMAGWRGVAIALGILGSTVALIFKFVH